MQLKKLNERGVNCGDSLGVGALFPSFDAGDNLL
jgi:hypothetical protein